MIVDEMYMLYDYTDKHDSAVLDSVYAILYGLNDSSFGSSDDNCRISKCEGSDHNG